MAAPTKTYTWDDNPPNTNVIHAAEVNKNFDDLYAYVQAGVDTFAAGADPFAVGYKLLREGRVYHPNQITQTSPFLFYPPGDGANALQLSLGSDYFYFDKALYDVTGRTTKLHLSVQVYVGATAPAVTFTFGFYPIASITTGNPVLGTVVSGSTAAITTPGTNSRNHNVSGDFTAPAAGDYGVAVAASGAESGTVPLQFAYQLRLRQV